MDVLIKAYLNLVENPKELLSKITDFNEWLDLGSKEDLICTLKVFESDELYEECAIIRNKITLM